MRRKTYWINSRLDTATVKTSEHEAIEKETIQNEIEKTESKKLKRASVSCK